MNNSEWIPTNEAQRRTGVNCNRIRKLIDGNKIRAIPNPNYKNRYLVNIKDLIEYSAAHPQKEINTIWGEISAKDGTKYFPLFGYDYQYFITDKNKIVNMSNGRVLEMPKAREAKDGYKEFSLVKNGKRIKKYLHQLIGDSQCPNELNKTIWHHIKPANPSNDTPSNLIAVWDCQHKELHKLLNNGNTEDYKKLIKKIKKENSTKTYKINHPDYEDTKKIHYYMLVNSKGFKAYKQGKTIPYESIILEGAEKQINEEQVIFNL